MYRFCDGKYNFKTYILMKKTRIYTRVYPAIQRKSFHRQFWRSLVIFPQNILTNRKKQRETLSLQL